MTKQELKYVNSLKSENEKVKNLLLRFMSALGKTQTIEDVQNISLIPIMVEENNKIRTEIKAEAIKEFVKKLCEDRVSNDPIVIAAKSLLKEMEGDKR